MSNLYSYGRHQGPYNNTVRTAIGMAINLEIVDTLKKKGMIYEIGLSPTSGYYNGFAPNNTILEVEDTHANVLLIFPMFILNKNNITHRLGIGIGASTLLYRDYYDENGTLISTNTTNYPDLPAFKFWQPRAVIDYELALRGGKKMGYVFGLRYNIPPPSRGYAGSFIVTEGEGVSIKFGLYLRFGMK